MALRPAVTHTLAVLLVAGIAMALYVSVFLVWSSLSDRADATCAAMVDGDGVYSVTPSWRGGIAWECEYATVWNPRGTVVITPDDLLRSQ